MPPTPPQRPPLSLAPNGEGHPEQEPGPGQMPAARMARWLAVRGAGLIGVLAILLLARGLSGPPRAGAGQGQAPTLLGGFAGFLSGLVAITAALLLLAGTAGWALSHLQWRWSRVRSAIARRLRQQPNSIKVRVWWSPLRPWIPDRVRFRYPTSLIQSDPSPLLIALFLTDFGIVVTVDWTPTSDWVVIRRVRRLETPDGPEPVELSNQIVGGVLTTLEPLLGGLRVDQDRTEVDENGHPSRIVLSYDQTTKDVSTRFRSRVQGVIESKVHSPTGAWTIRWATHEHTVVVRPCEPLPEYVLNEGLPAGHSDLLSLPVGRGSGGHWVYWCPHSFPHFLISGATGGGKTAFIRTILVMALMCGWRVWIIDPKQTSFQFFKNWPGVERVCTTGFEMRQAIFDHRDEMQRVYDDLKNNRITHDQIVPLLLIFDEVTEGFADIREWVEENFAELKAENSHTTPSRELKRAENALWRVTRKGREGECFQVAGLQRPDTAFIPGEARDNLVSRAGCGHLKGDGLEMMFEDRSVVQRVTRRMIDSTTGEEREASIPGRMTVDVGHGPEPVQAAWTPDPAPGKHTPEEMELLLRLEKMVEQGQDAARKRRLKHQPVGGASTPVAQPAPAEAETPAVQRALPTPPPPTPMVRARELQAGQQVTLETDTGLYAVEIVDVDLDEDSDTVFIDYCTLDDEGQAGGYEIDADELLALQGAVGEDERSS